MRVLLIGGRGSIGRRYEKILKFLDQEVIIFDTADREHPSIKKNEYYIESLRSMNNGSWDKAIVCSPTKMHYSHVRGLLDLRKKYGKKDILVEKPVSKDPLEIEKINQDRVFMVCNYKFALVGRRPLEWTYYNTGSDGAYWDLIQLLHINPALKISTEGTIWKLKTNEGDLTYREVEQGYHDMVSSFLFKPDLWDMNDALEATNLIRSMYVQDTER